MWRTSSGSSESCVQLETSVNPFNILWHVTTIWSAWTLWTNQRVSNSRMWANFSGSSRAKNMRSNVLDHWVGRSRPQTWDSSDMCDICYYPTDPPVSILHWMRMIRQQSYLLWFMFGLWLPSVVFLIFVVFFQNAWSSKMFQNVSGIKLWCQLVPVIQKQTRTRWQAKTLKQNDKRGLITPHHGARWQVSLSVLTFHGRYKKNENEASASLAYN